MSSRTDSESLQSTAQNTGNDETEEFEQETGGQQATTDIDLKKFPWYPVFQTLCAKFQEEGHELRVVGGAVRDIILSIKPKDIDMCTTADPTNMLEILKKHRVRHLETGIQHGTITVCKKGFAFEVTSLREDFISRGEKVLKYGSSFKEDARRRDLTINAMSVDVDGRLYDYFQGQDHLKKGMLLFTDRALERVTEDPLRILRYFRFASCSETFSVNFSQDYQDIFSEKRSALADPSIVNEERMWREFGRILVSPKCCQTLDQMRECKILRSLGFPVLEKPFKDLIDPTFTANRLAPDTKAAVILGIIFKGKIEMLQELVTRWRLSNKIKEVSKITAEILDTGDLPDIKKHLYALRPNTFEEEKSIRIQALKSDKFCRLTDDQIEELENFERPTFIFTKDHFAKVPKFKSRQKDATDLIKEAWVDSCFTMEIPEMLDMVRKMVDDPEILRERVNSGKT